MHEEEEEEEKGAVSPPPFPAWRIGHTVHIVMLTRPVPHATWRAVFSAEIETANAKIRQKRDEKRAASGQLEPRRSEAEKGDKKTRKKKKKVKNGASMVPGVTLLEVLGTTCVVPRGERGKIIVTGNGVQFSDAECVAFAAVDALRAEWANLHPDTKGPSLGSVTQKSVKIMANLGFEPDFARVEALFAANADRREWTVSFKGTLGSLPGVVHLTSPACRAVNNNVLVTHRGFVAVSAESEAKARSIARSVDWAAFAAARERGEEDEGEEEEEDGMRDIERGVSALAV